MIGLGRYATTAWSLLLQRLAGLSRRARLTGLAMLALAAALFEPHWNTTRPAFDYVVTLDVTQSMNVRDYELDGAPASRLVYAKQVVRQALAELPCGSRVGWAVFTEYRVLLLVAPAEVCDNYHELIATLERIDGRMSWAGASEVAKGLYWGLRTVKELGGNHGIVFFTDGHEAPPVSPLHKPVYDGKPGEVRGLIVGVGGDALMPIPKHDPEGRPLGFWAADEVMQTDGYSAGRTGSAAGEGLVDESGKQEQRMTPTMTEHLSSLKGEYLQNLARETGLSYHRLRDLPALVRAMQAPELARPAPYRADGRLLLAGLALIMLVAAHLPAPPLPGRVFRRRVNRRT